MNPVPVNRSTTRPASDADVTEPIAFPVPDQGLAIALAALVTYRARQTRVHSLPVATPQRRAA